MTAKMLPFYNQRLFHAEWFIIDLLNGVGGSADSQQRMPSTESLTLLSITKLARSNEFIV